MCEWNQIFVCISIGRHVGERRTTSVWCIMALWFVPGPDGPLCFTVSQSKRYSNKWLRLWSNDSDFHQDKQKARWMGICGCSVTAAVDWTACPIKSVVENFQFENTDRPWVVNYFKNNYYYRKNTSYRCIKGIELIILDNHEAKRKNLLINQKPFGDFNTFV